MTIKGPVSETMFVAAVYWFLLPDRPEAKEVKPTLLKLRRFIDALLANDIQTVSEMLGEFESIRTSL